MRRSEDFRQTVRSGVRIGRPTLVLHAAQPSGPGEACVGFIVGKAVGSAVTRNRVRRRLRHLAAAQLPGTLAAISVVVRALPRAATAPTELPADLASAWSQAMARLGCVNSREDTPRAPRGEQAPEPAGAS
jgi:ribonuclease P protein component